MASQLPNISRFVVLMLENRSFDHLFGYHVNPLVDGLRSQSYTIPISPANPEDGTVTTSMTAPKQMPYDPGHEFDDVYLQQFGVLAQPGPLPAVYGPPPMNGFVWAANQAALQAHHPGMGSLVMQAFNPQDIPILTAIANQGALFNYWFAPLPGPTWPNRFFLHAGSSGGLTQSPSSAEILAGYDFSQGTIYERLTEAGQDWRIYHDGLPQSVAINNLKLSYLDRFTSKFQDMDQFAKDVHAQKLPAYTFIEPAYDTGNNFLNGNSMHPLNNVAKGEGLIKEVYDALFNPRNSPYWKDTMLIITCDEHGGFYDHVPPPAAVPTGFDAQYANPHNFAFDRYGVRVPAIVISAYTAAGTVIGSDPADRSTQFDHTSILKTLCARFGMNPLTNRDWSANTLEAALNLEVMRTDLPASL